MGLGAARTLFGPNFQPGEALKALVWFADGDLHTLSAQDRTLLMNASITIGDVPRVPLAAHAVD